MFVDSVKVLVRAGCGGNGVVSFRHEKYIDHGGPDGGDGGRGGNVIFRADERKNTLVDFRYKHDVSAKPGEAGGKRQKHGRNGADVVVSVPVGTEIYRDDVLLGDLDQPGRELIVARGGNGGFGNAHFKSSVRQTPRVAELGEKGDEFEARLELKLLADVGLIGLPNAGKSTLLSVVTKATPDIADYPFTTLIPNLGVADIDDHTSLLIADIPGLIAGASDGKGLGDAFLRHVERTSVLLHLIDVYTDDVAAVYTTIRDELSKYNSELLDRPEIVALTKIEGVDQDIIDMQTTALRTVVSPATPIRAISASAHTGTRELMRELAALVAARRQTLAEQAALEAEDETIPTISLSSTTQDTAWRVSATDEGYAVTGAKIERFAERTDFNNIHAVNRLRDIMKKLGITHELMRHGAQGNSLIIIGDTTPFTLHEQ